MGCTSSRSHPHQHPLETTIPRALSFPNPLVHHPSVHKGDSHHLVSLTSTTYGSLHLHSFPSNGPDSPSPPAHLPHSPSPDDPTAIINAWELMDGLDDSFSPTQIHSPKKPRELIMLQKKPLWKHISEETLLAEMDPIVISALQSPSKPSKPSKPVDSPLEPEPTPVKETGQSNSPSEASLPLLEEAQQPNSPSKASPPPIKETQLPNSENRVVVYFTSLRGIRRTYEDCCSVRAIFRSLRVAVDERDVSMDSSYRKEMESLVGRKMGAVGLPQVFVSGKHVGGAEEVRQMHESGELGEMVLGLPVWEPGFVCEGCGDARFVPCGDCSGSRKVFVEEEEQLKRCGKCNENGLVRCPQCCS